MKEPISLLHFLITCRNCWDSQLHFFLRCIRHRSFESNLNYLNSLEIGRFFVGVTTWNKVRSPLQPFLTTCRNCWDSHLHFFLRSFCLILVIEILWKSISFRRFFVVGVTVTLLRRTSCERTIRDRISCRTSQSRAKRTGSSWEAQAMEPTDMSVVEDSQLFANTSLLSLKLLNRFRST